jgi:hypothetical protein
VSEWQRRSVPLSFDAGDRRLLTVTLDLMVRQVWLNNQDSPADLPAPPGADVPKDCAGLLVRAMPLARHQPRLRTADGYFCYVRKQYQRYFVDLTIGFERYEAKFSGKTRSTLRRKAKKLAELNGGKMEWRKFAAEGELDEFFTLAYPISARTYQQRMFGAGLPDTDDFRDRARRLARDDLLRAYLLFHAGQPAAYLYCPVREDALIYEYLGYLPECAEHSVGTVLQWLALQDLFAGGRFRYFDFTEGESEHKRLFSTGSVLCGDVYFLRRRLGIGLLLSGQILMDKLSAVAGRVLERLGLKAQLRRYLRFGAAN